MNLEPMLPAPILVARLSGDGFEVLGGQRAGADASAVNPGATSVRLGVGSSSSHSLAEQIRSLLAQGADAVTIVDPDQADGWHGDWYFVDDAAASSDVDRGRIAGQVVAAVLGGAAAICCRHPRSVRRVIDGLAHVEAWVPGGRQRTAGLSGSENANGG